MSRLGMLYALTESDVNRLRSCPEEERYDFMLEEFEETLFGSERACELDRAWEGIQFCLGEGRWCEENFVPFNIIFGGEFLVDGEDEAMTLKSVSDVEKIVAYLKNHDLKKIIKDNFAKIDAENFSLPKDEMCLEHLLGWSEGILKFYENALKANHSVIFTVDF